MATKYSGPMYHFKEIQKKALGNEELAEVHLHPLCNSCRDFMYWDRLDRIAGALETLVTLLEAKKG